MCQNLIKPVFIVIDGIDGTGKSTQTKLISDYLKRNGFLVVETKEPGGTALGGQIRKLLLDKNSRMQPETEMLLFYADRMEHQHFIKQTLEFGKSLVCDRFIPSTWAYQVRGGGVDEVFFNSLTDRIVSIYPDLTVIIDLDEAEALKRATKRLIDSGAQDQEGRFESKNIEYFKKVRAGFLEYALSQRYGKCSIVNGEGSVDEVQLRIKEAVDGVIHDRA